MKKQLQFLLLFGALAQAQVGIGNTSPSATLDITKQATDTTTKLLKINNTTAEVVTVLNSGNVGIGTTSPTAKLHTVGGFRLEGNGGIISNPGFSNGNAIMSLLINTSNTTTFPYTRFSNSDSSTFTDVGFNTAGNFQIDDNDFVRLFINHTSGNVGIGNNSPTAQLHTTGSVRFAGLTTAGYVTTDANGNISSVAIPTAAVVTTLYSGDGTLAGARNVNLNGNNLGFTGTGNVGIGTTVPAAKLDVVGSGGLNIDFQTTGRARINGSQPGIWFSEDSVDKSFIGQTGSIANHAFGVYSSGIGAWQINMLDNGNVGIGTTVPSPSAILDLSSSDKGLLLPRLELASIASPEAGLMVYDNTANCLKVYTSNGWSTCLNTVANTASINYAIKNIGKSNSTIGGAAPGALCSIGSPTVILNGSSVSANTFNYSTNTTEVQVDGNGVINIPNQNSSVTSFTVSVSHPSLPLNFVINFKAYNRNYFFSASSGSVNLSPDRGTISGLTYQMYGAGGGGIARIASRNGGGGGAYKTGFIGGNTSSFSYTIGAGGNGAGGSFNGGAGGNTSITFNSNIQTASGGQGGNNTSGVGGTCSGCSNGSTTTGVDGGNSGTGGFNDGTGGKFDTANSQGDIYGGGGAGGTFLQTTGHDGASGALYVRLSCN